MPFRTYEIIRLLNHINYKVDILMANMQDAINEIQAQTTVIDSTVTLLNNISDQLKTAQQNNDPQAVQNIIDQIDANTKKLSDAVAANTVAQTNPDQTQPIQATNV